MAVYLHDADLTVYHGDALATLRELPAESVHMCVTSPPFYGLRDYGTGTWQGGDPDCDHLRPSLGGVGAQTQGVTAQGNLRQQFANVCGKCGARRVDQQIGLEASPDAWVASLVAVFREVHRVLRRDGTLWVEVGDSYAANQGAGFNSHAYTNGISPKRHGQETPIKHPTKPKDLVGAPWLLAFALRADGWYLRSDIIWARPNPMPESVTDRPTKSHSYVFLLAKQPRYYYDADAIREPHSEPWRSGTPEDRRLAKGGDGISREGWEYDVRLYNPAGRNKRSVWTIPTQPLPDQHYAAYPEALVEPCILAGTSERGVCPECGAPWVREVHHVPIVATRIGKTADKQAAGLRTALSGAVGPKSPTRETTGWRPTCAHGLEPVPAVVLDPFLGSGTTALVARRLGRQCVGIELSEDYCRMIARRTQQLSLLGDAS